MTAFRKPPATLLQVLCTPDHDAIAAGGWDQCNYVIRADGGIAVSGEVTDEGVLLSIYGGHLGRVYQFGVEVTVDDRNPVFELHTVRVTYRDAATADIGNLLTEGGAVLTSEEPEPLAVTYG